MRHLILRSLCGVILLVAMVNGGLFPGSGLARAQAPELDVTEQDPWEPFNEKNFALNRQLDRFVVKSVARGWGMVLPDPVQTGIRNVIRNLDVLRRVVNSLLQLKFDGAGRELSRFVLNSTVGVAGLFDVAHSVKPSDEDTGQTLGFYGVPPGPYLVLPFLPVTTVRDGVGTIVDVALNPLNYIFPLVVGVNGVTGGIYGVNVVNERLLEPGEV